MRHDLRMAVPALGCWAAAALLVGRPSVVSAGTAIGALMLTVVSRWLPDRAGLTVAVAAMCVAAVAASCAWRIGQSESSPVAALAEHRRIVDAEVQVRRDAVAFERPGRTAAVTEVVVRRISWGGTSWRVRAVATAFLEHVDADDLVVGRRLTLRGRLSPGSSSEAASIAVTRHRILPGMPWWWRAAERVRDGVRHASAGAPGQAADLVPALVVGDDSGLSDQTQTDFDRAGLTHLTAVSGTNLTIVLAVVLATARAAGVRRRRMWWWGGAAIVAFVLIARPDPSVLRAAAMGAVGVAGVGYGARGGVRALAWALLILLFADPWLSRAPGFVLSVVATAGILLLAPPLGRRLGRWMPRWCAVALAVPFAAQLACTPVLAALSGEVSLVAVLANVLAAPAVAPATVLGLAGGLADLAWHDAAHLAGVTAGVFAAWIVAVAHRAAGLDAASFGWPAPWWGLAAATPVLALLLLRVAARPVWSVGLALGLVIGMWRPPVVGWPPAGWVMVACDVGQGDATVLRAGDGSAVLVDAGPEPRAVDRCLDRLGIRRIRLAVFTHDHADHVAGWPGARAGRRVDAIAVGPSGGPVVDGVPRHVWGTGDSAALGGIDAAVLWPRLGRSAPAGDDGSSINDASLVLMVRAGGLRFLLTGDIEPPAQERLLASDADLAADVLKVPHHGSARQSADFFAATGARIATVSAGVGNDYGHPASSALSLVSRHGCRVWRTDVDGDIAIVRRGDGVRVVTR